MDLHAARGTQDLPAGGDPAVDRPRRVPAEHEPQRQELRGQDPLAVGVGEQGLVPAGEQARGEASAGGQDGRARQVEQFVPALVGVTTQRQPLPGGSEVALGDARPSRGVGAAGRTEGGEITARDERRGGRRIGARTGIDHEPRASGLAPEAGGRELHERQEVADGQDPLVAVGRSFEQPAGALRDLGVGARRAQPRAQLGQHAFLVEVGMAPAPGAQPGLTGELREGREVGRRDQVQRPAHDRRLDDRAPRERTLEVALREAREPGVQRDIRRRRMLGLERAQAPYGVDYPPPPPLDQKLAGGERGRQLGPAQGPRSPGYGQGSASASRSERIRSRARCTSAAAERSSRNGRTASTTGASAASSAGGSAAARRWRAWRSTTSS